MKKQPFSILLLITCLFAAFTLGLFIGRNHTKSDMVLSVLPTKPAHNTPIVQPTSPEQTKPEIRFPLDINTASQQELEQLPGIGPELAGRIVLFRSVNGPFTVPEDLMNVDGIGPGKLEAILDLITTGGNAQ